MPDFAIGQIREFYILRQKTKIYMTIDLSWILSNELLTDLIGFMFEQSKKEISPSTYHTHLVLSIKYFIDHKEELEIDGTLENFLKVFCGLINDPKIKLREKRFVRKFLEYRSLQKDKSGGFDLDIWYWKNFDISPDRINLSQNKKIINFVKINNEINKYYIKKYTKQIIELTGNSQESITSSISSIIKIINNCKKSVLEIDRQDVFELIEKIDETYRAPSTFNKKITFLKNFFDYLHTYDFIEENPFCNIHYLKKSVYAYNETAVDNSVIIQIMNCLDKFQDKKVRLMFLIQYCTGMRVSEVCQIKKNCLEKRDENYFIRFYSQKMKKDVTNVIPKALYSMIEEHVLEIKNQHEKFIFLSKKRTAYQAETFRQKMKTELAQFSIVNPDGTPYDFKSHSYRHTMGKKMLDLNIPFQYIQEQLHHESPEMTLAYVEYTDKVKIRKMKSFINIHAKEAPIPTKILIDDDEVYTEYLRKFIKPQILTNGVCARPIKLGKCPHYNSCLTCHEFRTSTCDLNVHKTHLAKLDIYIDTAKNSGWVMQIEDNEKIKNNLVMIIDKLEKQLLEDSDDK